MNEYHVLILYRPFSELTHSQTLTPSAADETIQLVDESLQSVGLTTEILLVGNDYEQVLGDYDPRTTLIFNYCDGYHETPTGYDPITRTFEAMGFAFTGADDETLWAAQDKATTQAQLVRHGIPTPQYRIYDSDDVGDWDIFPAFVKPARLHASLGILPESVVETSAQLRQQVQRLLDEFGQPALVEDFIEGSEFRVSLWGDHHLEVLPLVGFHYPDRQYGFKDYTTKWDEIGLQVEAPARVRPAMKTRLEAMAKATFHAVRMRDYGGIDIRVRGEQAYVIDPNQNPDISTESSFLRSIHAAGLDYSAMLARIVRLAAQRMPR